MNFIMLTLSFCLNLIKLYLTLFSPSPYNLIMYNDTLDESHLAKTNTADCYYQNKRKCLKPETAVCTPVASELPN